MMKLPKQKTTLARCLLATLLVLCTPAALSAELSLMTGYQFNSNFNVSVSAQLPPNPTPDPGPGDSLAMEDGQSFSMGLDFDFANNPDQRIGLFLSTINSSFEVDGVLVDNSLEVTHLHFTGTNFYPQEGGKLSGFVTGGIGIAYYETSDTTLKDVSRISAQLGGGFRYDFTNTLALQMDIRWIPTFFSSNTAIFCNGGCVIAIDSRTFDQIQLNAGLRWRF